MLYSLDTLGSLELSIEARKLTACNQGNVLCSLFSSSRTVIIRGGDYVFPVQVFSQIDPRPANAMKNAVWGTLFLLCSQLFFSFFFYYSGSVNTWYEFSFFLPRNEKKRRKFRTIAIKEISLGRFFVVGIFFKNSITSVFIGFSLIIIIDRSY